jgi:hypothetical protein
MRPARLFIAAEINRDYAGNEVSFYFITSRALNIRLFAAIFCRLAGQGSRRGVIFIRLIRLCSPSLWRQP